MKEKCKIVHVYKSFNVYNGLIEILSILAQGMDKERFQLIACVNEYTENEFGEQFKKHGGIIENLTIKNTWYNELGAITKLYKYLKSTKPHIVQTHVLKANCLATIVAKAANVPVIIATEMTLKDIAPTSLKRLRDVILQKFTMYSLSMCDSFVVTSNYIKNQWYQNALKDKIETVYPPFNIEKYKRAFMIRKEKQSRTGNRIGFVGRLSEEKSVKTLLDAIVLVSKVIPDITCTIVGTGPLDSELKQYAVDVGLKKICTFTGYKENTFEVLQEIDILVLPSRTEGCPIVILEGMAMGLPVIATDVGGNPELVIPDVTGILIPVNNPDRLSKSIEYLVKNRDIATKMGQEGKRIAFTKFHPSVFTQKLQSLYVELLSRKT